jgi:DNA-binding transcriptional MerR regulator
MPISTAHLTIQEASRRTGLSEPTLRYYEEVKLIGPIEREPRSGHRRYAESDVEAMQTLACLRALGMGIAEMRTYQANRGRGREAATEQRDLLNRHAGRIEEEIEALGARLEFLREKAAVWDARSRGDEAGEASAWEGVERAFRRMGFDR